MLRRGCCCSKKFRDPIIRILLLAAVLSLAIGFVHRDFTESIGIICAIILATCVGFWFEWDAQRRFRRLNRVNDDVAVKVMRDGSIREIPRREVVVGDVVYVESGETIPADGELVEAVSLKINESTLTGEPEVDKTVDEAHFDPEATYPSNVVLRGTTVADGYGILVVTAVGDHTEAGRVTEQSTVQTDEPTPLDRQLTRLSQLIGRVGIALSALIFCVMLGKAIFVGDLLEKDWLTISQQVLHIFMVSVALIVMAVPEGLPMSITLSLAMSMRRMLKTNNLVRKMHACETMGAVTVICTDKTGTLTQNRMHVQELVRYDALPERGVCRGRGAQLHGLPRRGGAHHRQPLRKGALLEWLRGRGEDYEPLRAGARIIDRLTFSTERKYMATIIRSGISGRQILCVKGAPEIVRAMCAADGNDEAVAARLLDFQNHAMRTLAVAWAETATSGLPGGGGGRGPALCGRGGDSGSRARGCPGGCRTVSAGGYRRQDRYGRHARNGAGDCPSDRTLGRCPRYGAQPHYGCRLRCGERRGAARTGAGAEDHVAGAPAGQAAPGAPAPAAGRGGGRNGRRHERRPGAELRQRRPLDGLGNLRGEGCLRTSRCSTTRSPRSPRP